VCGIAGILNAGERPVDPALARLMIEQIQHRGPDARGLHVDGGIALAHARLSIIDLSAGDQPMTNEDRSLWVTFNGEIFNYIELRAELIAAGHRFATRSDTEVILHAYEQFGPDCVHRFNGQWAFAIWDAKARTLFVSRDRLGVRPVFYRNTAERFVFASEAKAILALPGTPRELDPIALDQIFTFWSALPPRTIFRDVCELPPGHSLTVADGTVRVSRYWSPQYHVDPADTGNEADQADRLRELLSDATRLRLRSDVPVGAYLSGGLDSTVITALIRQCTDVRLRTFSISFDDPEFDESVYQQEASRFLRTEHEDIRCSYGDICRVFPSMVWHTEKPVLRTAPAPLYLLSQLVRERNYKVVLTGEGSDEVLGGYDIFKEAKIRRFWAAQPDSRYRPLLLKRLYPYLPNLQNQSDAYLKAFFHVGNTADPFYSHVPRWDLTSKLKVFFSDQVRAETRGYDAYDELRRQLPADYSTWPAFCQAQYLETGLLLPGYILSSQGDRMAMAHSVEGRFPFLDHRVVEFASRLTPSVKMKVLNEKYLLKRSMQGLVPPAILERSKQPYRAPEVKSFFQGESSEYVDELLSPDRVRADGIFHPGAVAKLVQKCREGKATGAKDNMALTGILSTALVVDQYVRNFGERQIDVHLRA
jgi:asparagine synthase (glutamine-hydrolysing)